MKKQLLSTFLACATIIASAEQPSKTALITHLKNVRNEVQNRLKEIPTEEFLKREWGTEIFLFLLHLFNEIDAIDQEFSGIKKLDELCLTKIYEMKTLDEITQAINDSEVARNLHRMSDIKQYEKYRAEIAIIFNKHHKAYCAQYPNGILRSLSANEIGNPDLRLGNLAQKSRQLYQGLLPKLDAKIKELETEA